MAQITRSTKVGGGTTLQSNTVARAADVETDMLTVVNAHNNHDTGASTWTTLQASGASTVPLIVNNSSGTQDIARFQDNGATVVTIADGGNVTSTGKHLGPDGTAALPTYSFSSAGSADNGLYLDTADTPAISAGGTKRLAVSSAAMTMAVPIAMGTNKITGMGAASANGDAVRWEQLGVVQTVQTLTSTTSTSSSGTAADVTNLTVNITPTSASNRILVTVCVQVHLDADATETMIMDMLLDRAGTIATFNECAYLKGNNNDSTGYFVSFSYIDSPASTSALTYKMQFRRNASSATGNVIVNRAGSNQNSSITVQEIK